MPANQFDLFARFNFKGEPGLTQLGRGARAFGKFKQSAQMAKASVSKVGAGLRQLTFVSAGAAAATGWVVKKTMDFNKQMSVVKSVTQATGNDFVALKKTAMEMGATTSFTAKQAGDGMEALGRAGMTTHQIIAAIEPTLKMAAADSMDLGSAASIVAAGLKQFGLRANQAGTVADLLAYTSAKANTNVSELGEALKYSGPTAKAAGQDIHETVGSLALLANIGIRGSMAGTALKNAIIKLSQQGRAATTLFGGKSGLTKALTTTDGKMRPLTQILFQAITKLKGIKNEAQRTKMAFEIFGVRGKAAMDALMAAKPEDLAKHFSNIKDKAKGMANSMAQARLDNLAGDLTLLKSAAEGVAISIGNMIVPSLRSLVSAGTGKGGAIGALQNLAKAINMVNTGATQTAVQKKYGSTIAAVAFGIKEAIEGVKEAFRDVGKMIKPIFARFVGDGGKTVKTIAKLVTKGILFLTLLAPMAAGLGAVSMASGGLFKVLSGGFGLLRVAMSPFGLAITAIALVLGGLKKKGESTFGYLTRVVKTLYRAFQPLISALQWMVKHMGVLGTVLGVGIAAKGAGMLFRGLAGRLAGRGGAMGALGRLAGGMGMPVYVTNWPIGMGGMMGGGAAAAGRGGGLLARLGMAAAWAKGIPGVGIAGGAGAKAVAIGMGGLAASVGTFFLGIKKLADAHSKKEQEKLRNRLMATFRKEEAKKGPTAWDIEIEKRRKKQEMEKMAGIQKYGGPMRPTRYMGETLGKVIARPGQAGEHFYKRVIPFLKQMYTLARAGRVEEARTGMWEAGMSTGEVKWLLTSMTEESKKYSGISSDMVKALSDLSGLKEEFRKGSRRPVQVTLNIDGKKIAIATANQRQEAGTRAGKTPKPGAKRKALRTGRG